ncbi:hypothetical protein NMY22_g16315 [Coprinellus aureogranulatus]|nr:hypothetical protein NMY22_g16315 [Coprinellus aureogranulatus]
MLGMNLLTAPIVVACTTTALAVPVAPFPDKPSTNSPVSSSYDKSSYTSSKHPGPGVRGPVLVTPERRGLLDGVVNTVEGMAAPASGAVDGVVH